MRYLREEWSKGMQLRQRQVKLSTMLCVSDVKCFMYVDIIYIYFHNAPVSDNDTFNSTLLRFEGIVHLCRWTTNALQ